MTGLYNKVYHQTRVFARTQNSQERAVRLDHDTFLGGEREQGLLRGVVVRLQHDLAVRGQTYDLGGWTARAFPTWFTAGGILADARRTCVSCTLKLLMPMLLCRTRAFNGSSKHFK